MAVPMHQVRELPPKVRPLELGKERIPGVETMRVLAMVAVIGLHTPAFTPFAEMDQLDQILFCLVEQSYTFAVPFFFLASGYFFGIAVNGGASPSGLLWRYAVRLLPLFVVWYGVYAILPWGWPQAFMTYGLARPIYWQALQTWGTIQSHPWTFWLVESWQLWFLPALVLAHASLALLVRLKARWVGLGLALLLYSVGTSANSHAVAELVLALLFTILGWCLSDMSRPNVAIALVLLSVGYALQVMEAAVWWRLFTVGPKPMPYLLGTIPFAVGIFLLAIALPRLGASTPVPKVATLTIGIYLLHNLFTFALPDRSALGIPIAVWLLMVPVVIYLVAASLSLALTRFALTRWLITGQWEPAPITRPVPQAQRNGRLSGQLSTISS